MKHIKYHNKTEKEALEYTSKLIDFGLTLIVYAALNEMLNAYYLLQRSRYFKQSVKRLANQALKQRNAKVLELKEIVMHRGFAESYWDAVIDACEEDVSKFRAGIEEVLTQSSVEDFPIYAQAETARVLLEAAKIHYEEVIRDCSNKFMSKDLNGMKNLDLFDAFHEFYIDSIYRQWQLLCDELYKDKKKDIILTNDNTISLFNVIANKFARGTYIDECLEVASRAYPEFSDAKIIIED